MAYCLTHWSAYYSRDEFYQQSYSCSEETAFSDDEGTEVMSILDDIAEAQRHNSVDDIDGDPYTDNVSLWDDVFTEQWVTKDSVGGPTLAELNGELTDVEHSEPPRAARKRKASQSTSAQNSGKSEKICNENVGNCVLEASKETGDTTCRLPNDEVRLTSDQERSVPLEGLSPLKTDSELNNHVHDQQLKTTCASYQVKLESADVCKVSVSHLEPALPPSDLGHLWEMNSAASVCDTSTNRKKITDSADPIAAHSASVAGGGNKADTDAVEHHTNDVQSCEDASSSLPWSRTTSSSSSSSVDTQQKQYFWLYNIQSKGPKCQPATSRFSASSSDPHVLSSFRDPVDARTRTSEKSSARQRDRSASDVDANPRRLLQIGNELQRLTAVMSASPTVTVDASLSPREKNKYASRICRLKRKAQHEANKIKLQGLEHEHRQLMAVLSEINTRLVQRVKGQRLGERSSSDRSTLSSTLQCLIQTHMNTMIAGRTDEYVSCCLERLHGRSHR